MEGMAADEGSPSAEHMEEDPDDSHAELDDLLLHMSIASMVWCECLKRSYLTYRMLNFGPTSFHWQLPSANIVARLQRQLARSRVVICLVRTGPVSYR